ncbi:hypothetical protein HYS49_01925 [Candidatus Woesearchaeota archaeon]|nr:hypothetical protein [Candidatus Woesearchaeota archaeon]
MANRMQYGGAFGAIGAGLGFLIHGFSENDIRDSYELRRLEEIPPQIATLEEAFSVCSLEDTITPDCLALRGYSLVLNREKTFVENSPAYRSLVAELSRDEAAQSVFGGLLLAFLVTTVIGISASSKRDLEGLKDRLKKFDELYK